MNTDSLPINDVLDEIRQVLSQHHELVLQAPPGAGKTTMVPLSLLNEPWIKNKKILLLEPRRMAARTAAERMASNLDEKVGNTVGYIIRQENKVSAQTKIIVITEGVLTRMLQDDPELDGIGLIIFDEFHERNLNTDLGLALSLQARELFREPDQPLKLLIMSATLDGKAIARLLGDAPQLTSQGRMFPVSSHFGHAVKPRESITDAVTATIHQAIIETPGSILVFLPGQREIINVQKALQNNINDNICILPLYGALPLAAQMNAISPLDKNSHFQRKIVLATDIAETSITIPDISTVVDSGLCRQPRFDPATGMTRLHTRRVSQASSIQRMGRAGRTQQGHCYRLWSESSQNTLEKQTPPEILQADLCPLALQLLRWGINDLDELHWLDKPPAAAFNQALDLLHKLGATQKNQGEHISLTKHGEQMALFPTHPRLAHMLIKSVEFNQVKIASALATLLSDKDPLRQYSTDISSKISVLIGDIPCEKQFKGWFKRSQQQMLTFKRHCQIIKKTAVNVIDETDVCGLLIALAYPDRIAQRRQSSRTNKSGRYLLSNGRAGFLFETDKLTQHEYLAIAETGGQANRNEDSIYAAAYLNPQLFDTFLSPLVSDHQKVEWDEQSDRMVAELQQRLSNLVINIQPLRKIPIDLKHKALMQLVRQKGLRILPWSDDIRQWCWRIECLRNQSQSDGDNEHWPDLTEPNLLATIEHWLQPYVDPINKIDDFKKLDLKSCLSSLLPWPLPKKLDELAPLTLKVPSGSNIKIDYSQNPPILAVKLQEMFGCSQTPTIAGGKVKLLVHLLSPARKPLQITQDLEGFWSGSYQDVKKEMKGRYPKHPWPDDPLQALATRFTKHKRKP